MNEAPYPISPFASAKGFPIRFWIVDNSGSMGLPDGQKLAKDSTGTFKMIQATRWQELLKDIEDAGTLEPNDKAAFKREVERLGKLPVWLVFRLCTNDDNVIDYYNELDEQGEQPPCRTTTLGPRSPREAS